MGLTVLIVDDSATTRSFVRRVLQMVGIDIVAIHEAPDGAAALQLLAVQCVDLVLADLHMPIMGGVELIRRMLADERLKRIPVLIVSADPNTARLENLQAAGVAAYLRKPFTPEEFRSAIKPVLEKSDA